MRASGRLAHAREARLESGTVGAGAAHGTREGVMGVASLSVAWLVGVSRASRATTRPASQALPLDFTRPPRRSWVTLRTTWQRKPSQKIASTTSSTRTRAASLVSRDVAPLGKDDVGEQEKIEDERGAVHPRAERSASVNRRQLPRERTLRGSSAVIDTWHCSFAPITNCDVTGMVAPEQCERHCDGRARGDVPGSWPGERQIGHVERRAELTAQYAARGVLGGGARDWPGVRSGPARGADASRDARRRRSAYRDDPRHDLDRGSSRSRPSLVAESSSYVVVRVVRGARASSSSSSCWNVDVRGGAEWCSGVEPDDAVRVKTRTKRRTGLDHITQ